MFRPAIPLILLATVSGQDPGRRDPAGRPVPAIPRRTLEDLQSGVPGRITKAAVELGELGAQPAAASLRKALRILRDMDRSAAQYAELAVLDALVRLRAAVPGEELDHLLRDHALPAAMLLMARAPKDYEPQLLTVFETAAADRTRFCWLAAGNLLAGLRSARFARALLSRMRVDVHATLIRPGDPLPDTDHTGIAGGGSGTSQRYFFLRKNAAFGLYELDSTRRHGDTPVAKGPVPIYGRRLQAGRLADRIRIRNSWRRPAVTARQLEWAALLLRTEVGKLPFQPNSSATLFYRDASSYRRDIERLRMTARGNLAALAHRLRRAGLLTGSAPALRDLEVKIHLHDHRPAGSPALPEIPGVATDH